MKKLFTTLVMTVACAFAMAQAPDQINYQAVCGEKNAEVTVEFAVLNGEETVYTETQTVTTNAAGVFTTKVGGAEGWAEVNWAEGGLKLKTTVNGVQVSVCDFATVPYAMLAQKYVGQEYIENDVQDLVEGMRMKANVDDIYDEGVNIARAGYEIGLKLTDVLYEDGVLAQIDINTNDIELVTSDVQGIQENMRMKADASAVDEAIAEEHEYAKTAIDWITNFPEEVLVPIEERFQAIDVTGDVADIQDAMRMKANASDVASLQETVDIVSSDLTDLVDSMRNYAKIADVDQRLEDEHNYAKAAVDFVLNFNDEVLVPIQQAITDVDVTSQVADIQDALRMKANASDVAAVQEAVDIVSSDLTDLVDSMRNYAKIADVDQRFEDEHNYAKAAVDFVVNFNDDVLAPIQEVVQTKADADRLEKLIEVLIGKGIITEGDLN